MPSKSASGILEEDVPELPNKGTPNKGTQRRANGQNGRCEWQAEACSSTAPTVCPTQCQRQASCTFVACETGGVPVCCSQLNSGPSDGFAVMQVEPAVSPAVGARQPGASCSCLGCCCGGCDPGSSQAPLILFIDSDFFSCIKGAVSFC